ncbi:MAG: folate-binding protein YgfZ [Verrucomicrobium sp.]|nr:glycine cleavage T C-terminal barrel domain-containing protein [Verrucomicrobium sp.]
MTQDRFEAISARGGAADLSARAKWTLTGGDRVRYLNGQVTNQVKRATVEESVYACVTNVKGRIEGDIFVHAAGSAESSRLVVDAEAGLRESLGMRLERYIIADDVELLDVTEEWQLWHFFGEAVSLTSALDLSSTAQSVKSRRFGLPGVDIWWPASEPFPTVATELIVSPEELEAWRILQGVPAWPTELNGEVFPPEAGLQDQGMDYAKGCYIGQEILSRIKTTGKMPQTLVRLEAQEAQAPLEAGAALYSAREDDTLQQIGHVTSVTLSPSTHRPTGLAYVKQAFAAKRSLLLAPDADPKITFLVDIIPS